MTMKKKELSINLFFFFLYEMSLSEEFQSISHNIMDGRDGDTLKSFCY